ncbi:RNA polymerase sigma factor [Paenibacillus albiflavus]|uniref:RNA polymerase sigma factor n=1 Tax=Paenibacillus albiflavus TaxID=2545760 RepID=A0A4R4E5C8_9BACL|nr:RNA polymerase sigma factor [Paenibacillus albiflavus]TCZ74689.1 RNA polymerase sigma factor [Paenibacillus albiflavus]
MESTLQRTGKEITEVYHRHVNTVYKVCYMLLKKPQDAEDATQTVFVKLIQSNKVFEDVEHEKAWLIVTSRNECKNRLKHWWRRLRTSIDDVDPQVFSKLDTHDEVLEQVLSLSLKYRLPIFLFYYEGYSTKEISCLLSIKESTIRSQLHTARQMLKLKLGGESGE